MPSVLLAPGTDATESPPQTVLADKSAAVFLTSADGTNVTPGATLWIQLQRSAGAAWVDAYKLSAPSALTAQIPGPCVFRIRRPAPGIAPFALGADLMS